MSEAIKRFYQFGPFCVDVEKRALLREGEVVPLSPKAFDTLLVLVQHRGEVLEKDQLMEMLWPDSEVEEANLPLHVSAVRKALGESPTDRRYIITIPGRGYRFAAEVTEPDADASDVIVTRYTKSTVVIQEADAGEEGDRELEQKPVILLPSGESSRSHRKWVWIGVALAVLAIGAIAIYIAVGKSQPPNNEIHSIAILPFVNGSADPNAEYLSDGITESLINSLSQLSQLKVVARTTAFRYKGKETDAQLVGRDLHVDAMITGRVTQQGDNLIVQSDLLSAADGSQLWGARYTRKLSDVFAVQEQIAKEIAGNLRFKLTGAEKQALSRRYTENIRAYQNYMLGWSYLQRRTREDFFAAIDYFEKAIEEEPNYALAYAALTEAYVSITTRGLIEPDEGRRKAREVARKALALDPSLAEAHAAFGAIHVLFAPFDFSTGDTELRRAIELNPNLSVAHLNLGASLMQQGRLDEAAELWLKAREIDPLSPIIARLEAWNYMFKREYPRSLEMLGQSYDIGPPFIIWGEIEFYIQNGKLAEGRAELEKAKLERKDDPFLIFSTGMIATAQGKRDEALRTIKELEQVSGATLHRAMWIAMIYAAFNEKELALEWLERGFDAGAIILFFKDEPVWDAIRGEPRFQNLLQRMGLKQ